MENFKFKKKYGQNFIIDNNVINNIVKNSNLEFNSLVIEIGPGSGALTKKLSSKVKNVLCYEIDETLKPILNTMADNVEIIYGDFLKQNISENIKKYKYKKLYVVANLPYYITTPIIMKIIDSQINPNKIVIMVQKEVGKRLNAKPNNKEYGSLTVFLNYYFNIKKIMNVSRNVFLPKPNVDSIVVELVSNKDKKCKTEELLFKLIKDSFKYKRKNLKNNLKGYNLNKIAAILKEEKLDLNIRAESLTIDQFIKIADKY